MKKLCSLGYKISQADKKAFDHYVLVTPKKWGQDALAGMVNKAVKTIMRDWYEIYKLKQVDTVSADRAIIIPAILAMPEFKPYHYKSFETPVVARKEPRNIEIWGDGFDVEDYEEQALRAFYEDPEEMLRYFIENKIYQRKKAFVNEFQQQMLKDPLVTEIPSKHDDFINMVCAKQGYKNRATRDAEEMQKLKQMQPK